MITAVQSEGLPWKDAEIRQSEPAFSQSAEIAPPNLVDSFDCTGIAGGMPFVRLTATVF
jgi:hypothetical protein